MHPPIHELLISMIRFETACIVFLIRYDQLYTLPNSSETWDGSERSTATGRQGICFHMHVSSRCQSGSVSLFKAEIGLQAKVFDFLAHLCEICEVLPDYSLVPFKRQSLL